MQTFHLPQVIADRQQQDRSYPEFLRVPSMSAGIYFLPADGTDPQRPHTQDEVYYIIKGRGSIRVGSQDRAVKAGDFILLEAREGSSHAQRRRVRGENRMPDLGGGPADGSRPASELIGGDKAENTPRFSPDGKRIVFVSTRDGAAQVYVADANGRGVKQVTRLSGGVQPPLVISGDSKRIAFVSDAYSTCTNEDCNKKTREGLEKDPIKMRTLTGLAYRHWDEWRESLRHHVFVADIDPGETRDVTPGDFDSPPHFYEDNVF